MQILFSIIGFILALPILVTIIALVCVTLVGGYIALVLKLAWWLVLLIIAIIVVRKLLS